MEEEAEGSSGRLGLGLGFPNGFILLKWLTVLRLRSDRTRSGRTEGDGRIRPGVVPALEAGLSPLPEALDDPAKQ